MGGFFVGILNLEPKRDCLRENVHELPSNREGVRAIDF